MHGSVSDTVSNPQCGGLGRQATDPRGGYIDVHVHVQEIYLTVSVSSIL